MQTTPTDPDCYTPFATVDEAIAWGRAQEDLIAMIIAYADRLVATVDVTGEPFHAIGTVRPSMPRSNGTERKREIEAAWVRRGKQRDDRATDP